MAATRTPDARPRGLFDIAWDIGKGLYERGEHAVYAVDNVQRAGYCLILSVISTVVDLALFGRDDFLANQCKGLQGHTGALLSEVTKHLIRALNPQAVIKNWTILDGYSVTNPTSNKWNSHYLGSWAVPKHLEKIILSQQTTIDELYSSNFLKRELGVRVFGLVSGLALTIMGVALTAFGALATIFALITFGYFPRVNAIAVNNLRCIALVLNQPHQGIIGLFRPSHLVSSSQLADYNKKTKKT